MNKIGDILEVNSCLNFTIVFFIHNPEHASSVSFPHKYYFKAISFRVVGLHYNLSLWQQTLCIRHYKL